MNQRREDSLIRLLKIINDQPSLIRGIDEKHLMELFNKGYVLSDFVSLTKEGKKILKDTFGFVKNPKKKKLAVKLSPLEQVVYDITSQTPWEFKKVQIKKKKGGYLVSSSFRRKGTRKLVHNTEEIKKLNSETVFDALTDSLLRKIAKGELK